jgi:alanine racemase
MAAVSPPSRASVVTLVIGYADGYDRRFGTAAFQCSSTRAVGTGGGSVCMDM